MRRETWILFATLLLAGAPLHAQRTIAITLDDLPFTGSDDAAVVAGEGRAIVETLARHSVPACGFVTGRNVLVAGQADMRFDLLRQWAAAGMTLENHGFAHLSYHRVGREAYFDDLVHGEGLIEHALRASEHRVRFFRAPFNHTGDSDEARQALSAFLAGRDVALAPFTVEHADYVYDRLYRDAVERGDREAQARVGAAYVEALGPALDFAEAIAEETFGRAIPQVLLIHTNRINARHLDTLLKALTARGYRYVSLEQALEDPAFGSPQTYAGPHGISWFHRWRRSRGLEDRLRDEPDPPRWILDAYRALTDPPAD